MLGIIPILYYLKQEYQEHWIGKQSWHLWGKCGLN